MEKNAGRRGVFVGIWKRRVEACVCVYVCMCVSVVCCSFDCGVSPPSFSTKALQFSTFSLSRSRFLSPLSPNKSK